MKKCSECGREMEEKEGVNQDGIRYQYFKCQKCGEEVLNMEQLHSLAEKYRALKLYHVTMTRWGQSLGLRIPKELVIRYHLRPNEEVAIIPEKEGIRIMPGEKR